MFSKSLKCTLISTRILLNSRFSSHASCISFKEIQPFWFRSIVAQMRRRSCFIFCCTCALFLIRSSASFSRASAAESTMTAKIKFTIPSEMVSTLGSMSNARVGSASITGTAIAPQLSPATMVWNSVSMAASTLSKPNAQRSQPSYTIVEFIGCTNSTRRMAQSASMNARSTAPKKMALNELAMPTSSTYNSRTPMINLMPLDKRPTRRIRNQAMLIIDPNIMLNHPVATMQKSRTSHLLLTKCLR
mmetsp:Transcript_68669/g.210577  ORF Transcript_68669/g.210577 Transcript_68669/m.210577 type:complete len:246 (-) Transcript_68669:525-1262(-)